jgi:hypothetical protein
MTDSGGDYISATVTGNVSGQVGVGKNIAQTQTVTNAAPVTDEERAELQKLFADLKAQIAASAPAETQQSATERVDELEEALNAGEPDMSTVQYVKRWFLKKLPSLAGLITGVLVNPIVGKLVQGAGDAAVAQLDQVAKE